MCTAGKTNIEVVSLFCQLAAIDSPSGLEKNMADELVPILVSLGFDIFFDSSAVETDSNTNQIIAKRPGTTENEIAFSSHLDCVEPCKGISPIIDWQQGMIRSDGTTVLSADDKAGIAEIFCGIKDAIETKNDLPNITWLLSVKEEQGLVGAKSFPTLFEQPVLTLVFDVEGHIGQIASQTPSRYAFTMHFKGKAAHAGFESEKGINAIVMAAEAISLLPVGRLDDKTTLSLSAIDGGSAQRNVVAESCVVEGEFRSLDPFVSEKMEEKINCILETVSSKSGGITALDWRELYPGYAISEDDFAIRFLRRAADTANVKFELISTGGGSDANILNSKGCVAVALASGMSKCHSTDEYILIEDLVNGANFVKQIVIEAGKSNPLD